MDCLILKQNKYKFYVRNVVEIKIYLKMMEKLYIKINKLKKY